LQTLSPLTDIVLDLPDRQVGKVRVSYALDDGNRLFVTTDRLSAFDHIVAAVPYKGQVLNQLAAWWFEHTADIIDNHIVSLPDPNATIAIAATPLPVEVIVRGVMTGSTNTSLWKLYEQGKHEIYGYTFADGIAKNTLLEHAIITPTTKGDAGAHDEPLTCDDVVARGLVSADNWATVQRAALALFARGQELAKRAGLMLADTKYEFGIHPDGRVLIIDEMHTPDSSRYWELSSYDQRIANNEEPESLDKEPIRLALSAAGYRGDGTPPPLDAQVITETTKRYITAYERITGTAFLPGSYPVQPRLVQALQKAKVL
jgi:phosphoribosylaminoimidazole-succinocarboxamide synthase